MENNITIDGDLVLVDSEFIPFIKKFKWNKDVRRNRTYYYTMLHSKKIYLHRFISGIFGGFVIDHVDRNTSNNTLENLDITTSSGNAFNAVKKRNSKYRGIYRNKNRWTASVQHKGEKYDSRGHKTEEDAARAYDKMAFEISNGKAILNFPEEYKDKSITTKEKL